MHNAISSNAKFHSNAMNPYKLRIYSIPFQDTWQVTINADADCGCGYQCGLKINAEMRKFENEAESPL
jgi:hypothetical protein